MKEDRIDYLLNQLEKSTQVYGTQKMSEKLINEANSPAIKTMVQVDSLKGKISKTLPKIAALGLATVVSLGGISMVNDNMSNDISQFATKIDNQVRDVAGLQQNTVSQDNIQYEYNPDFNAKPTKINENIEMPSYKILEKNGENTSQDIEKKAEQLLSEYRNGASIEDLKKEYIEDMDPQQQEALKQEFREMYNDREISLSEGLQMKRHFNKP